MNIIADLVEIVNTNVTRNLVE